MSAVGVQANFAVLTMSACEPKADIASWSDGSLPRNCRTKSPTKCEIAHTSLKRNSLKLVFWAAAKRKANGKREREPARVLVIIDGDTRITY
jgi:hypothetical protein